MNPLCGPVFDAIPPIVIFRERQIGALEIVRYVPAGCYDDQTNHRAGQPDGHFRRFRVPEPTKNFDCGQDEEQIEFGDEAAGFARYLKVEELVPHDVEA